jgi:hypothetical protein
MVTQTVADIEMVLPSNLSLVSNLSQIYERNQQRASGTMPDLESVFRM